MLWLWEVQELDCIKKGWDSLISVLVRLKRACACNQVAVLVLTAQAEELDRIAVLVR